MSMDDIWPDKFSELHYFKESYDKKFVIVIEKQTIFSLERMFRHHI